MERGKGSFCSELPEPYGSSCSQGLYETGSVDLDAL